MVCVILREASGEDFSTRLSKSSVELDSAMKPEPTSYEEAALQQHPKIEWKLEALCKDLALLNLRGDKSIINMTNIFRKILIKKLQEQNDLGEDAMWKHVNYESDDEKNGRGTKRSAKSSATRFKICLLSRLD